MGVVGLLGLLIGSFAILSASVFSQSSPSEYSAADGETPALRSEVEHLNEQTAELRLKLEDVGVSENATLRWTMGLTTENASTALTVNGSAWELGGKPAFDVSQMMGVWRWIELFGTGYRHPPAPCEELIFNLTGSTVDGTWRSGKSDNKRETKIDLTVDTQAPHHWNGDEFTWTWVTTDYANWAVLMSCRDMELSSCGTLLILSRERTLPPATLEMLMNVAEQRGLLKALRFPVNQTSC